MKHAAAVCVTWAERRAAGQPASPMNKPNVYRAKATIE